MIDACVDEAAGRDALARPRGTPEAPPGALVGRTTLSVHPEAPGGASHTGQFRRARP